MLWDALLMFRLIVLQFLSRRRPGSIGDKSRWRWTLTFWLAPFS